MKVYLDDERQTPTGWVRTYTSQETIELLRTGRVIELSLDHDLGSTKDNGYEVILWIEEHVHHYGFEPPVNIVIHSANSSAAQKMVAGVAAINRMAAENKRNKK